MELKIKAEIIRLFIAAFLILVPCHSVSAKSIGVIMTADAPYYQEIHKAFADSMGNDVEIILQKPMADPMSWTNAARKLTGLGVSVIVCYGAPATITVQKETSDIPIIFAGVYDPESMSLVGKNATGVSSTVPVDDIIKHLNSIKKIAKLGIIFSKSEKDTIIQVRDIKKAEGTYGFESVMLAVGDKINKDDIKGVDGIFLTSCSTAMLNIKDVIEAARKDKIPTAALFKGGENAGVVLTLAANPDEQGKALSEMVKQVLGGSKPSDLSMKQGKKIDLIINSKEAKTLGLTVPAKLLSEGKVIE